MCRRCFHKLLCRLFVNFGPRIERGVHKVIMLPEGNEKPSVHELPATLRSAVGTTAPSEHSEQGASSNFEKIALDDDATLENRDGVRIRAGDAKLYDFPEFAMASRNKVSQAGAPVNRTFNRLFGDELPVAPRGSIVLFAVGFVGEEIFVVDFPTRLFSRALRMHLNKVKRSIAEVTGQGDGGT